MMNKSAEYKHKSIKDKGLVYSHPWIDSYGIAAVVGVPLHLFPPEQLHPQHCIFSGTCSHTTATGYRLIYTPFKQHKLARWLLVLLLIPSMLTISSMWCSDYEENRHLRSQWGKKCPSRPLVVTSGVGTTSTFPCGWEIDIIDVFLDHYSAHCGTVKGAITAHIWTSPTSRFYFP